ncbi:MAG: DUF3842 family protein [Clostridia bacterium]|nr:DUF3842 family protein [Clostridia bacterium]
MKVVVIDAQGGGVGRMLTEQLKKALPSQPIIALGTNALATAAMLKAGADQGATGENAIRVTAAGADLILAPIGMLLCDGILGEVTGVMAAAIGASRAHKILVPSLRCGVTVAGTPALPMSEYISQAVQAAVAYIRREDGAA